MSPKTETKTIPPEVEALLIEIVKKQTAAKTPQEQERQRILNDLAIVGGKMLGEEDIIFAGNKMILPEGMTYNEARDFLYQKEQEAERHVNFSRTYNYRPWDGGRATHNVLLRTFGSVLQQDTQTMWGPEPPQLVTINVDHDKTEQIPWGTLAIPPLPGVRLELGMTRSREYGTVFQLQAVGPKMYRYEVDGIFALVGRELETNSLYRGKAFDGQEMPHFLDLSGINPEKIVYMPDTQIQLEANIWSLMEYSDEMKQLGVGLKRAILLTGGYGEGKTATAHVTAQRARHGQPVPWTCIICLPGRDKFEDVMQTAKMYQPCVVFFEDIDSIADVSNENIRQILDIFDGMQAKGTEVICVLTTNHIEKIHKGMLRPGRLDAIIELEPLDAEHLRRLVEVTVPSDMLSVDLDWETITGALEGFVPAFAVEAIDRTKRHNFNRTKRLGTKLETADFVSASAEMRSQLKRMEAAEDEKVVEPLSVAVMNLFQEAVDPQRIHQSMGEAIRELEGAKQEIIESVAHRTSNIVEHKIDRTVVRDNDGDQTGNLSVEE